MTGHSVIDFDPAEDITLANERLRSDTKEEINEKQHLNKLLKSHLRDIIDLFQLSKKKLHALLMQAPTFQIDKNDSRQLRGQMSNSKSYRRRVELARMHEPHFR